MAVPEMAALVPPADEKLGGSVLEAGGDVEIDLGGLSFSLRIGEIEKVKGGGTIDYCNWGNSRRLWTNTD